MLRQINVKLWSEAILKPTPGKDSLYDTSNDMPYSKERQRVSISFTNVGGLAVHVYNHPPSPSVGLRV
jgi:hypothetical protein